VTVDQPEPGAWDAKSWWRIGFSGIPRIQEFPGEGNALAQSTDRILLHLFTCFLFSLSHLQNFRTCQVLRRLSLSSSRACLLPLAANTTRSAERAATGTAAFSVSPPVPAPNAMDRLVGKITAISSDPAVVHGLCLTLSFPFAHRTVIVYLNAIRPPLPAGSSSSSTPLLVLVRPKLSRPSKHLSVCSRFGRNWWHASALSVS
jgi:hypothetical protein